MYKRIPILQWLPQYNKTWIKHDLLAGLTVGVMLIPQGMAYAMVAGMPPVHGLYAALVPTLVYAILGTSRQLAVGPVAIDSLLVALSLGAMDLDGPGAYLAMAFLLSFMVGGIQLILGIFRMGFFVNYMSRPVISGFTSGAAIIILLGQIKHLIGVSVPGNATTFFGLLGGLWEQLGNANPYDLTVGLFGVLGIVLLKRWFPKFPGILLVVITGIVVVTIWNLQLYGVHVVGEVPKGLPSFTMPQFTYGNFSVLSTTAITLAIIGFLEAISIGKSLEEQTHTNTLDANQELMALGTANMLGSFFQSIPVTSSFSRSAVNRESGAKTQLSAVFTVALVALTLLFLTPLFHNLPNAVLAALIMVAVIRLIDLKYPRQLWNRGKDEFMVLLVTFLVTVLIGVMQGVLFGVLIALLVMVYRSSKPHVAELGRIGDTHYYKNIERFGNDIKIREDLLIIRFDAPLYFGNTSYFKTQMQMRIKRKGANLKGVILNAEAINYIDSTAAKMLVQLVEDLHQKQIEFYIAGAIGPVRDTLFKSGIVDVLYRESLFAGTLEAVAYFDDPKRDRQIQDHIALQNKIV